MRETFITEELQNSDQFANWQDEITLTQHERIKNPNTFWW